jgi:phytoene synthase
VAEKSATADDPIPGNAETIAAAARAGEPDRYLAALLSPAPARPALLALAAFSAEIGRVPFVAANEPAIGEIRLQWWREALDPARPPARTGSPIADALQAAAERHDLSRGRLEDMIDARSLDVCGEVPADDAALRDYLWKSEGVPFALAARVVAPAVPARATDPASAACGHAYGLARLLLGLPRALSQGHMPLPRSRLDLAGVGQEDLLAGNAGVGVAGLLAGLRSECRAALVTSRRHVANLPREIRAAFLPLALVEPYLRALERPGRDLLRGAVEIVPLVRVYRIAMAHWLGRV